MNRKVKLIVEYAKKLPANTRDKLLRKIAKKNSYIKTLDNAFKQAIDINRETSFVEAGTNRDIRTTQTGMTITKIETGLTTEEDHTNTNTTGTNTKLKSSLNSQTKT